MATTRISVITDDLTRFVGRLIIKLVLDIAANLVKAPTEGGTPVDTGWARANWIPAIGPGPSNPVGSRESVSQSAQQAGRSLIAGYQLNRGVCTITNNVPYIVNLNFGSSKQAPAGFVQAAIEKAIADLSRGAAA